MLDRKTILTSHLDHAHYDRMVKYTHLGPYSRTIYDIS